MEKWDFKGWATRNDIRCSDGRTIRKGAFAEQDGKEVPLVWNHDHKDPRNVLGHAILENRDDGVYAYGFLNSTAEAQRAKIFLEHGDIKNLSIWANDLRQTPSKDVMHGVIREVSLVLSGANPGAYIEAVDIRHSEDPEYDEEFSAVIYTDEAIELMHSDEQEKPPLVEDAEAAKPEKTEPETTETPESPAPQEPVEPAKPEDEIQHSDDKKEEEPKMADATEKTVGDVFDELTDEQKKVVYYMIAKAVEEATEGGEAAHSEEMEDGDIMHHNVFEGGQDEFLMHATDFFAHSDEIFDDAKKCNSLKEAVLEHAATYGIDNIDYLFPEAKVVGDMPEYKRRDDTAVGVFLNKVHKSPFSKVKTLIADITEATARAKGYIKGNQKASEVFSLLKRTTNPTTIYKLQKFDRADLIEARDFDIIRFVKSEMRTMLDEETVRAALVGDGRDPAGPDKIDEQCIRPIWTDDDLYTVKAAVTVLSGDDDNTVAKKIIRGIITSRKDYKGSGNPIFFTTEDCLNSLLLAEDQVGRPLYDDVSKLATKLRVSQIVTSELLENLTRTDGNGKTRTLMGIIVNPTDYNFGADKGGEVSFFDDFDLDFNQQKFLLETHISGALTKPYAAIAVEKIVDPS